MGEISFTTSKTAVSTHLMQEKYDTKSLKGVSHKAICCRDFQPQDWQITQLEPPGYKSVYKSSL